MAIRKKDDSWITDIRPHGAKGKRIIRKFTTKAEATRFESFIIAQSVADKDWNPSLKDSRLLSELITIWRDEHGVTISGGRKFELILSHFCKAVNDPIAADLTSQAISKWRSERLKKIKATTANNELAVVKGMFNWLKKRQYITYENPAAAIENVKVQEQERPYLSSNQIKVLMDNLPALPDQRIATIIQTCLETGCRWSEAESLTRDRVTAGRIVFTNTKSKKKRAVPVRSELTEKLLSFPGDQLFRPCSWNATRYLNELLDLPKGISTHILRHTFASHFVMGGGNLITLQRILGHSNIEMTMRYAHLAPEHLEDALSLNPVSQMERKWKA